MSTFVYILLIFLVIGIVALFANAIEDYNSRVSFSESVKVTNMPIVALRHNDMDIYFLIDSGSDISYIDESIIHKLTVKEKSGDGYDVLTANGYMKTFGSITIDLMHNNINVEGIFTVGNIKDAMDSAFAPNYEVRGIIGSMFLEKYDYIIDYKSNELKCRKRRSPKTRNAK